jgi:hypothetical protein
MSGNLSTTATQMYPWNGSNLNSNAVDRFKQAAAARQQASSRPAVNSTEAEQRPIANDIEAAEYPSGKIKVEPATGETCSRCWQIVPTLNPDELCERCAKVVSNLNK